MPSHEATKCLPRRQFLLGSAALALAGCAPASMRGLDVDPAASFGEGTPGRQAGDWWLAFQEQQLSALIAQGHARNLDLAQAVEQIRAAEAGAGMARSADLPQIGATAQGQRGDGDGSGRISETSTAGLNVSWVLDIFGANRNAKRAAEARVDASRAGAAATKLIIEGAIAAAYVDLRFYQANLSLTRRSLESRRKSLELTKRQFEFGDAAKLSVVQAEQLVAEGEAQLPQYEAGVDQAIARLANLTAQRSAALQGTLKTSGGQPRTKFKASVGVPAEVIRARPDVQLAESLYQAAAYDVGVAKAAFWPSVRLGGSILPTNISGGGNVKPWSLGPSIDLPIFTAGANRANLRAKEAKAAEAHLAWQAAVYGAIEEVEVALASYNRDGRVVSSQQKLVETSRQAVELAQANFSIGEGAFMAVLDAERSYLGAQQGLAAAQRMRGLNFIQLSLATAGGTAI
ncbi:efflux transporter outer membrane subunit [Xinfangfangia sp. CPCC 101601]|uniref:Efflux transporter outer membrane subunit n=1 Tax=Pseudogemmobacter lacusdianii TaxID=3069608 RepID=A0ABU0VW79_9RHOB|nr:efflux transporter outer membrane subunit [Xinfangfangia sp. CPCC 101601]MDQ2066007.1 efflux transporter outer membrane subunit [Xinfangfangia sp. CPCC 101601]